PALLEDIAQHLHPARQEVLQRPGLRDRRPGFPQVPVARDPAPGLADLALRGRGRLQLLAQGLFSASEPVLHERRDRADETPPLLRRDDLLPGVAELLVPLRARLRARQVADDAA